MCADAMKLEFAGMISACNQIAAPEIEIEVDYPCLWITTTADDE